MSLLTQMTEQHFSTFLYRCQLGQPYLSYLLVGYLRAAERVEVLQRLCRRDITQLVLMQERVTATGEEYIGIQSRATALGHQALQTVEKPLHVDVRKHATQIK